VIDALGVHTRCSLHTRAAGWVSHPLESAAFHGAHPKPSFAKIALKYPPRKARSETYSGPITLSQYERFQFTRDRLAKEGISIPLPLIITHPLPLGAMSESMVGWIEVIWIG